MKFKTALLAAALLLPGAANAGMFGSNSNGVAVSSSAMLQQTTYVPIYTAPADTIGVEINNLTITYSASGMNGGFMTIGTVESGHTCNDGTLVIWYQTNINQSDGLAGAPARNSLNSEGTGTSATQGPTGVPTSGGGAWPLDALGNRYLQLTAGETLCGTFAQAISGGYIAVRALGNKY